MKTTTDDSILKGIIEKDDSIHQYLYNSILPAIISYVRKNRGTLEDAEDVFQDALVALHTRLSKAPFYLHCKFSTYLFQVCKNIWLKKLQRNQIHQNLTEFYLNLSHLIEPHFEENMELEANLIYEKYLNKLDSQHREIMRMRDRNVPYKEVVKKLNLSNESNARKIRYNCRRKICELIRKDPAFIELAKKRLNAKARK